ncbi:response regulator [Natrinema gelatinilyticum]|uniref:response regulator n=1 Tax=Natrinema gelatinilyticum TaxID=2961571 RepID=UPI0020C4DA92|nr:HalX domain-containing protein [Natrinema gelatinilyticum]
MTTETPSVLIVEDEPDLANLYAAWLGGECDVETAYDGNEALDAIDEDIDVVLLDRRMPGLSGDTVLDTIRNRSLDCRVAMVTAVEPDFDIIEMGFDDYLVKPVSKKELIRIIEQLVLRAMYDEQLQEFFALASKKALLDDQKTEAERQSSQEYAELNDRIAVLRVRVNDTVQELLEQDGYRQLCQDIARESVIPK